jgi:phage terminase small subunit
MRVTQPVQEDQFDLDRKAQFAALYCYGQTLPQALMGAGYGTRSLNTALSLLRDPYVLQCIADTREWINSKLADNANTILEQLERDRELAHTMENPSAAVAATMAKAKLLGLLELNAKQPSKLVITWGDDSDSSSGEAA